MSQEPKSQDITNRTHWTKAKPQKLPRPTYWPFFLALGLAFLIWGLLVGWIISIAGLVITAVAIIGWITELRHESGEKRD